MLKQEKTQETNSNCSCNSYLKGCGKLLLLAFYSATKTHKCFTLAKLKLNTLYRVARVFSTQTRIVGCFLRCVSGTPFGEAI